MEQLLAEELNNPDKREAFYNNQKGFISFLLPLIKEP
jgi:hypothetical protein